MKVREFLDLYDNWNTKLVINDNNLNPLHKGFIDGFMMRAESELLDCKVISFGFYDNELCISVDA